MNMKVSGPTDIAVYYLSEFVGDKWIAYVAYKRWANSILLQD